MENREGWTGSLPGITENGRVENIMFEFRIIVCADGMEIIDSSLKTPYESLTPLQMLEYSEMDAQLAIIERIARETRRQEEQQRKNSYGLLYKAACLFGLI